MADIGALAVLVIAAIVIVGFMAVKLTRRARTMPSTPTGTSGPEADQGDRPVHKTPDTTDVVTGPHSRHAATGER